MVVSNIKQYKGMMERWIAGRKKGWTFNRTAPTRTFFVVHAY